MEPPSIFQHLAMSRVCWVTWQVYCLLIYVAVAGITSLTNTSSCAGGSSPRVYGGLTRTRRVPEPETMDSPGAGSAPGGDAGLFLDPQRRPPRLGLPPQSHHGDVHRVLDVCHRRASLPAAVGGWGWWRHPPLWPQPASPWGWCWCWRAWCGSPSWERSREGNCSQRANDF